MLVYQAPSSGNKTDFIGWLQILPWYRILPPNEPFLQPVKRTKKQTDFNYKTKDNLLYRYK